MSEIKWIMKRAELRELLQDEDKQHWSDSALARCLKMSRDFVAKWRQAVMNTDLDDMESLKSRSRARLTSNKRVGEAVEAKILYYREILTEERNRRVGAREALSPICSKILTSNNLRSIFRSQTVQSMTF